MDAESGENGEAEPRDGTGSVEKGRSKVEKGKAGTGVSTEVDIVGSRLVATLSIERQGVENQRNPVASTG